MNDDAAAREGIRDLVARYNSNGDSGRFDPLLALFVADAVMELRRRGSEEVRRYEGRERLREIFTGAGDVVRGDAGAGRALAFVRHFTATHQIDLLDDDHATGRLYFQVLTDTGLDHWGRYVDRYVRVAGAWRFAERVVTVEGWSPTSAFLASG